MVPMSESFRTLGKGIQRISAMELLHESITGLPLSDFNNNGDGRCRECQGLGYKLQPDPVSIIDYDKKISEVPFRCWQKTHVDFFRQLLIAYCDEMWDRQQ